MTEEGFPFFQNLRDLYPGKRGSEALTHPWQLRSEKKKAAEKEAKKKEKELQKAEKAAQGKVCTPSPMKESRTTP